MYCIDDTVPIHQYPHILTSELRQKYFNSNDWSILNQFCFVQMRELFSNMVKANFTYLIGIKHFNVM